jgi:hypothetical protein
MKDGYGRFSWHDIRALSILRVKEVLMPRNQHWFELRDMRVRRMDRDAWIVLRVRKTVQSNAQRFGEGHEEEFFGAASAAFPNDARDNAGKTINWGNLSLMHDHGPCVQDGKYQPADQFEPYPGGLRGTHLVLSQRGSEIDHRDWLVHPDLILGLRLKREKDNWLAMDEGYLPVIRMSRDVDGSPNLMEIRSSHLKDFLAARNEFLCVSTYRSRELIASDRSEINWDENPTVEQSANDKWQGSITEITEDGHPFGSEMAVFHVGRKGFDLEQDVQQQIWAGFNVTPDGGVSRELLMAQAEGEPAETQAPEPFVRTAIKMLNRNSMGSLGFEVIRPHPEYERLIRLAHRFRAVDEAGFYALAKDLARITADSVDVAGLQKIVPIPKGEKRGSLKSLESVLATRLSTSASHSLMTPLFGVYELRHADAQLPPSDLDDAFSMIFVDRDKPWIMQGAQMLAVIVDVLQRIADAFDPGGPVKPCFEPDE